MTQNKNEMIVKACILDTEHSLAYCTERSDALEWNNYHECLHEKSCVYQKIYKLVEVANDAEQT